MNLSDSEKRDICRLIEQGKNIPEKYRFSLFEEARQVELYWNGKKDSMTNIVLPFQIIEQIDEPRTENPHYDQVKSDLILGRQESGWTNKLIWGDNKYILSSLKNGPMRDEIEKEGGIKLVYIDPPFDVGADFSMNVEVGDGENYEKNPNVMEHIAYRDTWGKGDDSFLSMIYERLQLIKDLLAEDASLFLHCDWRTSSKIRLIMDEIFGKDNFVNEIIWQKIKSAKSQTNGFGNVKDSIFFYKKGNPKFFQQRVPHSKDYIEKNYRHRDNDGRRYMLDNFTQKGRGPALNFGKYGTLSPPSGKHWIWKQERIDEGIKKGIIVFSSNNVPRVKRYQDEVFGQSITDLWNDIDPIYSQSQERIDYPTQKPEALIERIIKTASSDGDIVCDFFSGSGTAAAVAEKLGRKWICSDLGKFAIHTTRKRMINLQRELKKKALNWRAFEVLNLGKYQRQYFLENELKETEEVKINNQKLKIIDFENLLFEAYRANRISGFKTLHGKKGDDFVSIGPVNQPLSRNHVEEVIKECIRNKIISIHILGFEYEMGLFPTIQEEAKKNGIRLLYKQIPLDIFDKRAVERGEVLFYDVAYIDFKCHVNDGMMKVELTDFAVFYNEENFDIKDKLISGRSKIVVEQGQIVQKTKLKDESIEEKFLTKHWQDWIDYWSVDFNYESKKEFIKVKDEEDKIIEQWTGNYVFKNEWQSFRSRALDNKLEFITSKIKINQNSQKVAVKVIDIFGNDTMKVIEVNI